MSTKYATLAAEIIRLVGGPANIESAYHCQTRLRFSLHNESLVRDSELQATAGVATTRVSGGTYQVVVGTHVKDVFEEVDRELSAAGVSSATHTTASKPAERRSVFSVVVDFIAATFQPIVPALSGAGMIMALLAVLVVTNVITRESQTYQVLAFFANAVFYFLPIFVAISAADKLKTNRFLAGVVAAMMLHPTWTQMVASGDSVHLFDVIPLTLASYGSSVIPILLVILVQSYFERLLNRVVPNAIKLVFVPMITFLVMGTLAMSVLGPIGTFLGGYLAIFFAFLTENAPWVPSLLIGALLPVMVMFGVHNAVAPLGFAQLAQLGYDSIFGPGAICSNIAQGVATLVVAVRTKDAKLRQIATAGGITALMGITEPALYGVALPKRYPLIAAMIGGGAGGLYAGLTSTHRFAVGTSGLPAVFLYIGDDTLQFFVNILVALAISAVVSAAAAILLSVRFERVAAAQDALLGSGLTVEVDIPSASVPAIGTISTAGTGGERTVSASHEITAPVSGEVLPLAAIPDGAFSSGVMGPGLGIEPMNGRIVSPVTGTVVAATKTGHAFGIVTDAGVEVLVHIGVDTVQMKGAGFSGAVPSGTHVEVGQQLVSVDLAAISDAGHPATVILVVTNPDDVGEVSVTASGRVVAGEPVLSIAG
ncbi:PTS beta-glucoside transporter subunit EIIBCA [Plantibacter flavus]|nr:glucose PTS transporter subunit IIA [Plantibacter flavus]AQX81076.1 PTS beta-glucoside transporter subunit EIIBCA [Plantibacter flavus]